MKKEMRQDFLEKPEEFIVKNIKGFVKESQHNSLREVDNSPIFDEPLVGFAKADDPLFFQFKEIIGDFHLTPKEILEKFAAEKGVNGKVVMDGISVICWVLPMNEKTRLDNRKEEKFPSKRWSHSSQYFGEAFNNILRDHVVSLLESLGYMAVAPSLSKYVEVKYSERGPWASTWSERHALFVAGLGTFGLSEGLITPKGIAMRCGTVITNLALESTKREYQNPNEYCLFFKRGSCGMCMERCPAQAIREDGHYKGECSEYLNRVVKPAVKSLYGLSEEIRSGCGLCQTGVPCEFEIPMG